MFSLFLWTDALISPSTNIYGRKVFGVNKSLHVTKCHHLDPLDASENQSKLIVIYMVHLLKMMERLSQTRISSSLYS